MRESCFAVLVIGVLGGSTLAFAQDAAPQREPSDAPAARDANEPADSVEAITARKLFLEGRALLDKNQPHEACDLLERSHKLAPTLGALLNLGLCHSYSGHLATAHDYYRQAEIMATLRDDARREFAHDEAAALAARRATLTLRIAGSRDALLEVKIDDVAKPRDVWEHPMYLDAGEHRITVEGAGGKTWQGAVQVADGANHVMVIPEFQASAGSPSGAPAKAELPAPQPKREPDAQLQAQMSAVDAKPAAGLSTARVVALSIGGAGVVALGASLVYTLNAKSAFDDSNRGECNRINVCNGRGVQLRDDAQADATRATVLSIAGGAALAGGALLWFLSAPSVGAESRESVKLAAAPGVVSASWTGRL